jgi:hypothetical protein
MFLKNKGLFLLVLIITVVLLCSVNSFSTIRESSHDLSISGGGKFKTDLNSLTAEVQICIFCHTPHNAIVDADDGLGTKLPLWNRRFGPPSDPDRDKTGFTVYSSSTMNITMGQPKGYTLLCLSCHDGVTAINALVNYGRYDSIPMDLGADQLGDVWVSGGVDYPGMNIGGAYDGNWNIKDLSDDHPVSFVFDTALAQADKKLKVPTPATSKLKLFNGRIECPTCHNAHEEGGGYNKDTQRDLYEINMPFLRVTKDKSQICTECHIK